MEYILLEGDFSKAKKISFDEAAGRYMAAISTPENNRDDEAREILKSSKGSVFQLNENTALAVV